ncbi:copper resistance protein CopC [Psychrobacillus psychrodurans]|uniref:copper resistance CopC family protein n=1 Tax=Psychrobacillus psychrodurans TaxID=126157 RepID=UPI001F4EDDE1|nr:copper resistance protein CopC [Psychrobacillus psychrodurans]MCK1997429.1 copper resistance protein CopC [Psychrobacillus psychrodurans]
MKKICVSLLILLFTFTPSALAHTGLESSVPQDGEVITENISTLSLTFNTTIEDTSTFKVTKESGLEISLAEHIVKEKEMVGTLSSPLQDGTYIVTWKIIGEDGHPIEKSYSFSVVTSTETVQELSEPPVATEKNNSTSSPDQDIIYQNQTSNSNAIMVTSVVLLMVIALGTTFWLLKRGKN